MAPAHMWRAAAHGSVATVTVTICAGIARPAGGRMRYQIAAQWKARGRFAPRCYWRYRSFAVGGCLVAGTRQPAGVGGALSADRICSRRNRARRGDRHAVEHERAQQVVPDSSNRCRELSTPIKPLPKGAPPCGMTPASPIDKRTAGPHVHEHRKDVAVAVKKLTCADHINIRHT